MRKQLMSSGVQAVRQERADRVQCLVRRSHLSDAGQKSVRHSLPNIEFGVDSGGDGPLDVVIPRARRGEATSFTRRIIFFNARRRDGREVVQYWWCSPFPLDLPLS